MGDNTEAELADQVRELQHQVKSLKECEEKLEGLSKNIPVLNGRRKWLIGIVVTVSLSWVGWVSGTIISNDKELATQENIATLMIDLSSRISSMEVNRYTRQQGEALSKVVAGHEVKPGHDVLEERVKAQRREFLAEIAAMRREFLVEISSMKSTLSRIEKKVS